jgi:hypothetical protein
MSLGEMQACLDEEEYKAWKKSGCHYGKGDETPVLYRLPELLAGIEAGKPVNIFEGERDADIAAELDIVATSAPFGALNWNDGVEQDL